MGDTIRVAVLGASGYAGGELIRLLADHPGVDVTFLGAKGSAGIPLGQAHPHLRASSVGHRSWSRSTRTRSPRPPIWPSAAFPMVRARRAPSLLDNGVRVIDLAGDFRLPASDYPEWYGFEHPSPRRSMKAVYGLPELFADQIAGAQLIANPGLLRDGDDPGAGAAAGRGSRRAGPDPRRRQDGAVGRGEAANEATTYSATEDSVRPYRVPGHQHTPEMERGLELATGLSAPCCSCRTSCPRCGAC